MPRLSERVFLKLAIGETATGGDTPQGLIQVAVVSEVAMLRSALAGVLAMQERIETVSEHGCEEDLLATMQRMNPDVVVIDVDANCADCLSTVFVLHEKMAHCRLLVLIEIDRKVAVRRVARAGIRGLIDRSASATRVVEAVERIADGETMLDRTLVSVAARAMDSPLTTREAEVLQAVATGMSNVEITRKLALAPGTVRNYLSNAMAKTGTRTRIDAIRIATDAGWLLAAGRNVSSETVPRRDPPCLVSVPKRRR